LTALLEGRRADAEETPRQVKTARRVVVPLQLRGATPRARLGLDRRGKLASAARAAKQGLDKQHGIFERDRVQRSRQLNANPLGGNPSYRCLVLQGSSLVLWRTNAVLLRWNQSSEGCRLVLLGVVPFGAVSRQMQIKARGAGCDSIKRGSAERSCSCQAQRWRHMPHLGNREALPPNPPL
jgi:hypothetical protein